MPLSFLRATALPEDVRMKEQETWLPLWDGHCPAETLARSEASETEKGATDREELDPLHSHPSNREHLGRAPAARKGPQEVPMCGEGDQRPKWHPAAPQVHPRAGNKDGVEPRACGRRVGKSSWEGQPLTLCPRSSSSSCPGDP